MATKFCSNCGQPVESTSSFCPYCGLNFTSDSQQPSSPAFSQSTNYGQYVQAPVMQTQQTFRPEEPATPPAYTPVSGGYPPFGQMAPPATVVKKKSHTGLIVAIIAVILIAAAAVGSYFLFFSDSAAIPQSSKKEEKKEKLDPVSSFFRDIDWDVTVDNLKKDDNFTFESRDAGSALFTVQGFENLTDGEVNIYCSAPDGNNIESYLVIFDYEGDDFLGDITDIYGKFEDVSDSSSSHFYINNYSDATTISTSGKSKSSEVSLFFTNNNFEGEDSFYVSYIDWGADEDEVIDDFDDYYTRRSGTEIRFKFDGFETVYSGKTEVTFNYDYKEHSGLYGVTISLPYSDDLYDDIVDYFGAVRSNQFEGHLTRKDEYIICIAKASDNSRILVIIMENDQ